MAGKIKVMPMPRWPDSPYRTSTIGGTMIGIPRTAKDPEKAWKMIEHLYLQPDGLRELLRTSTCCRRSRRSGMRTSLKGRTRTTAIRKCDG